MRWRWSFVSLLAAACLASATGSPALLSDSSPFQPSHPWFEVRASEGLREPHVLAPGDAIFGTLEVRNRGTSPFTYRASASAVGDSALSKAVVMRVTADTGECGHASAAGAVLYEGPLTGALVGDRGLEASGAELLCVRLSVPVTATNGLQGASLTPTFSFHAEQAAL